ncbi:MAG: DNA recombination protein RmuC [Candidatus Nomurabacteria bacterium]|jgi:DNA recombination protein RmuC|nr:DNA recombination protein RmuC [Candidatus Nomurabacteria bacterium]
MEIALVVMGVALLGLGAALIVKSIGGGKPDGQLSDISRRIDDMAKNLNDNNLKANASLHKQFEASQKLVRDITERMTKFEATNKNVLNATDKLEDLQNILLNPKHRGNFGEFQLNSLLENFFPPNQWQAQYKFKNGDIVDAALFLKDDKILPIDSKFSLENYNRMVGEKSKDRREALAKEVYKDLKLRIDETSKYIRPAENTMDFAFMFVPSEALYYDMFLVKVGDSTAQRDLMEYAMRDKHVIVVSPTTFTAYLQTVLQGLRSLQIEEQAKEIQKRVGQLGQHIEKYDDLMQRLGNSLGTTINHYNNAHKELKKIDKDIVKISGGEESVEPLALDKPQTD